MEGKFTVSFTDGFNYLHVHNRGSNSDGRITAFQAVGRGFESRLSLQEYGYTGGPGTDDSSPTTYYKAMPSVSLF